MCGGKKENKTKTHLRIVNRAVVRALIRDVRNLGLNFALPGSGQSLAHPDFDQKFRPGPEKPPNEMLIETGALFLQKVLVQSIQHFLSLPPKKFIEKFPTKSRD